MISEAQIDDSCFYWYDPQFYCSDLVNWAEHEVEVVVVEKESQN